MLPPSPTPNPTSARARAAIIRAAAVLAIGTALFTTACAPDTSPDGTAPAASTTAAQAAVNNDQIPGSTLAATAVPTDASGTGEPLVLVGVTEDQGVEAALTGLGANAASTTLTTADKVDAELNALADTAESSPALIVAVGPGAAAAADRVSSTHLDVQFLLLGAQLPEPTDNVTAVVWPGANQRWDAGTDEPVDWDRAREALATGLAASTDESTRGHVIDLGDN